jgi:phage baseplate assembly protein W
MPVERVSKSFKDISMSFSLNPLNSDIVAITDVTAINRSIRNLVLTSPGERPFSPDLGSEVSRSIFENMDPLYADLIKDQITETIQRFEPRVNLRRVDVTPNYDNNEYSVRISYLVVGIDVPPQKLNFVLQSTR